MRQCLECSRPMVTNHARKQMTPERWREHRVAGHAIHHGRGLCRTCAKRLKRQGREQPPTRQQVRAQVVQEEWAWLANPWASDEDNAAALAPRLGMTPGALIRAVERLRAEGVLEQAKELAA